MCRSMVDIQSVTAEIRRGNKKRRKKTEETTGQKYNVRICYAGRHKKDKCPTYNALLQPQEQCSVLSAMLTNKVANTMTYYKSIATNNICLSYGSIFLKGLT